MFCSRNLVHNSWGKTLGPISQKPWKLFGPGNTFLIHLYLKMDKCIIMHETSCVKWTSVHIKNKWVKQICNHVVWDFTMVFWVQKLSRSFPKQAQNPLTQLTLPCCSFNKPMFVISWTTGWEDYRHETWIPHTSWKTFWGECKIRLYSDFPSYVSV